jgi:glycosyltransferase involved in cell wall biosynthesis
MNIAIFHELPEGGAKKAVNEIVKYASRDHTVDLYYVDEKKDNGRLSANSKFYKFVPRSWTGNDWKTRLYKDTFELINLKSLHKKIAGEIDRKKYDVVLVNASKYTQAPFILNFLKTFTVYYCHDPHLRIVYEDVLKLKNPKLSRQIYEKITRSIKKKIDKNNISKAKLLIANSYFTKEGVKKAYNRNADVAYLGIDEKMFRPNKSKKEIDVLFVGSKEVVDGYYDLMHACNYLPGISLRVLDFKEEWITAESEMRNLYCRSHVVVALAHNEPLGLVPLEAMSCGVPVVAVNEAGYKETILHNKTGYLVKRDPKQLAEKIKFLLQNKQIACVMGQQGRVNIKKNWTWEKRINELMKIVQTYV